MADGIRWGRGSEMMDTIRSRMGSVMSSSRGGGGRIGDQRRSEGNNNILGSRDQRRSEEGPEGDRE